MRVLGEIRDLISLHYRQKVRIAENREDIKAPIHPQAQTTTLHRHLVSELLAETRHVAISMWMRKHESG